MNLIVYIYIFIHHEMVAYETGEDMAENRLDRYMQANKIVLI